MSVSEIATTKSQLPAELQKLGNALVQEGQSATGISDLLRFMSREGGIWVFGIDGVENEEGALWAVNPLSFEHGYVCWKNKKVAGEAMVPVGVARPVKEKLEDYGTYTDGKNKEVQTKWDEQMSIRLKCVAGEDKGTEVDFRTSTVGGISCIKVVAKAVGARISAGKTDVVAVVELVNDSYNHAEFGKTFIPEMTIESWLEMDGVADMHGPSNDVTGDNADEPPETSSAAPSTSSGDEAPKARRSRTRAATEPVEAAEAPAEATTAPRRRRARSA